MLCYVHDVGVCVVLYTECRCMCCCVSYVGVLCRVVHCVYVYMIEEKQRHWVLVGCGNRSGESMIKQLV